MPKAFSPDTLGLLPKDLRERIELGDHTGPDLERMVRRHLQHASMFKRINGPDIEHMPFIKVVAMNERELGALLRGNSDADPEPDQGISLTERMSRAGRAVARVLLPEGKKATCFLIAPGLLLTNNHVLDSKPAAAGVKAQFAYETRLAMGAEFLLEPKRQFLTDKVLDVTVVAVAGSPEREFGYIDLKAAVAPEAKRRAVIIQHPEGKPKQVAYGDNEIDAVEGDAVYYWTDTRPGSSGSPVFNEALELIALHCETDKVEARRVAGRDGKFSVYWRNCGVSILAVRDWLKHRGVLS